MSFTKKIRRRLVCLITAASMRLSCFCMTDAADDGYYIDCSHNLEESGAYSVEPIYLTEGSAFTLDEFKAMLNDSENAGHTVICNFEIEKPIDPDSRDKTTWVNPINLKYGESGEKHIGLTQSASYVETTARLHYFKSFRIVGEPANAIAGAVSSGSRAASMVYEAATDSGRVFTYSFSPHDSEGTLEVVKSVGLASVGQNANVEIVAYYASIETGQDAGSDALIVNEGGKGNLSFNYFCGFQAPENCFITKIEFHSTGKFMAMDDLCLITEEVSSDMTAISRLELTAPDIVETPSYESTLQYNCSVEGFDQFGRLLDEEIIITVDNEDVAEITEDGKLIIKQRTDMPDSITVSAYAANAPTVTAEKVIPVDKSYSPYYNEAKIGVHNGNDDYVLSDFIRDMEEAAASPDKDVTMVSGDGINEEHSIEKVRVPLFKDKEKYFDLVHVFRLFTKMELVDGMQPDSNKPLLAPSGTHVFHIIPPVSGENVYDFDTSLTGDYRVTSFGFVYIGRGSNTNIVADGFGVHATFSDGTQQSYGKDQIKGGNGVKEENTFYGIKAPAGHYITRVQITTQPRAWACIDDFGFILEKPDILTIKPDYEQFSFSSFCDQDMNNITEDIALPDSTTGGCTVDWTALTSENENSDVIETGETNLGKLNVPEVPEKSNVRLKAAITYGALTFVRNFDLYVPSKLERDYKNISIPEKTKEDITLPRTGSEYGSTITWKSLNPELIDNDGNVTRPGGRRDEYCVLEATLTNESGTLVKEIGVTVEGKGSTTVGGGPGGDDRDKNTTNIVASTPSVTVPKEPVEVKAEENKGFNDVPKEHWAYESIAALTEKGIVKGMDEKSFAPEGTVTREQYLSMLVRAFGFTAENAESEFSDVEKDSWYFDAVSVAQSLGICGGYEDGSFGIGKEITREEMAVMAYRSALLAELSVESSDENIIWKDSGEISHFAYDAVAALNSAGIIKGISEEKFSPKTTTTRAQAAVIICRLLNAME